MSKKVLSILLAVVMLLAIAPVSVIAENVEDDILSYLTYSINNGEVTITDCDTSISGDVVIPDTIEGYPVTKIGGSAFEMCYNIENIDIPDSVTYIDGYAFWGCGKLKSIDIPESVEYLGEEAFQNCASLETAYIGASYIDDYAFQSCVSLETVTFTNNLTYIGNVVFTYCWSLESINIPESVEYLGMSCFVDCFGLKEVIINNPEMEIAVDDVTTYKCNLGYTYNTVPTDYDEFLYTAKQYFKLQFDVNADENEIDELSEKINNSINFTDEPQLIDGFTIHGHKNSTAEAYANANNINFVELSTEEPTPEEPTTEETITGEVGTEEPTTEGVNGDDVSDSDTDNSSDGFVDIIKQFFDRILEFFKKIAEMFENLF